MLTKIRTHLLSNSFNQALLFEDGQRLQRDCSPDRMPAVSEYMRKQLVFSTYRLGHLRAHRHRGQREVPRGDTLRHREQIRLIAEFLKPKHRSTLPKAAHHFICDE